MTSTSTKKLSKSEGVYNALRRAIILGELRPAEPLGELQVAQSHRCSQGPVREAMLKLQEEGLVNRFGYRGTIVAAITPEEIGEMLLLRKLIETRGAVYSLPRMDERTLNALSTIVHEMEAVAGEDDEFALSELDRRFHLELFRRSGLGTLEPILQRCLLHVHRYKILQSPGVRTLQETAAGHWPILSAIGSGDVAAVKTAISHHIDTICGDTLPLRPGGFDTREIRPFE